MCTCYIVTTITAATKTVLLLDLFLLYGSKAFYDTVCYIRSLLAANNFTGALPETFGNLRNLTYV